MSQITNTAKDIDTYLKASSKLKKIYTYPDYINPVIPITASTYKTGKHGSAKTRMLLKDFFTDSTFSDILDTDVKFTELEYHPSYKVQLGLITAVEDTQVKVINESYESIVIKEKNPTIIKLCQNAEHLTYVSFYNGVETMYKIKTVQEVVVY